MSASTERTLILRARGEAGMAALGEDIASVLRPATRIGLIGELGAGKTWLARSVLRALAADRALEVPSPTYTIVQEYDVALPVRHVDLYRVADDAAVRELGLGEGDAVELIEWPLAHMTLDVAFAVAWECGDVALEVRGPEEWVDALRRARVSRLLAGAGWGDARRATLKADASTRRYERLHRGGESAVLMDAPTFSPEPSSYAARARLADGDMGAFLRVGDILRGAGLSAPAVIAADPDEGTALLEDLGDDKVADEGAPVAERYHAAIDALAAFHAGSANGTVATASGRRFPTFDADLSAVEVALFAQWYLKAPLDQDFAALWREAVEAMWRGDDHLALRDVHSPNLMWLASREGVARVGFIDYQDAMIAPTAYDVVSLAQDARVAVPPELEEALVQRYLGARPWLDAERWRSAYHLLGAQRATRILGTFRRLNDRDGKAQYLAHIPRLERLLARNLTAAPALAPLAGWYARRTSILDGRP